MKQKSEDLPKKFEHIHRVICSDGFLNKNTVGGDIPFFISSYATQQEFDVAVEIKTLIKRLCKEGIKVLEINLYDLCIEILKREGRFEQVMERESSMSKEKFQKAIQSTLNVAIRIMPAIKEKIEASDHAILFITGIGMVFPYIRSHNILNNLQSVADHKTAIIYFPGVYNGISLELFGAMKDDNYYRAFNLDNYKV